jgi:peptidoglycan/xylan/chitin deacetylase (PgdA/CDA1 family)
VHIVTLSFDDGFRQSNLKIAGIYERFGLRACLNVLASPGDLVQEQHTWGTDRGGFELWNELQALGHEIMPHGYKHANKREVPFEEARSLITRCLDIFGEKLEGFDARTAVFNFPYNQSTPELEAWLPSVVRAYRTGGGGINSLPHRDTTKLTTTGEGPENCEWHIDQQLEALFSQPDGWLIYNTHGLDDEGWGPIRADYLERLLARLTSMDDVQVLPAGVALAEADSRSDVDPDS